MGADSYTDLGIGRIAHDRDHRPTMITSVISAIILAAGKSTRMGRPKASLPLDSHDTFLSRIVQTFRAVDVKDIVVVVGHDADDIMRSFAFTNAQARFVS